MFISVDIKKDMISDWKKITRMHTVFLIDKTAVGEDHKYLNKITFAYSICTGY